MRPKYPKNFESKRVTTRHIINELSKVKDKQRILKAAREKRVFIYGKRENPPKTTDVFINRVFRPGEIGIIYSKY